MLKWLTRCFKLFNLHPVNYSNTYSTKRRQRRHVLRYGSRDAALASTHWYEHTIQTSHDACNTRVRAHTHTNIVDCFKPDRSKTNYRNDTDSL